MSNLSDKDKKFKLWVEKYYDRILLYARKITGGNEDAEDVTQEAFMKLYESLNKGDNIRNIIAWLYTVAHNIAIDRLREKKRTPLVQLDDKVEAPVTTLESEEEQKLRQRVETVKRLLVIAQAVLTEKQLIIFHLKYIKGLPASEIAAILGPPATEKSVSAAYKKIREKLRKSYEERYPDSMEKSGGEI